MIKHVKWPDIEQFRTLIRNVRNKARFIGLDSEGSPIYDDLKPLPILDFSATTKLHGTSAAWGFNVVTGEQWQQSREQIITPEKDNAGFSRFCSELISTGFSLANLIPDIINTVKDTVVVYGEWCGGSIQKGVALNQLPKQFVIFGVKVDDTFLSPSEVAKISEHPDKNIFNIYSVNLPTFKINFETPEHAQNDLAALVQTVEAECPWGKRFGVSGVGEGFVVVCVSPGYEGPNFWAKCKGEKHQNSKVKTLVPVDIEKVNSINQFVANVVTPARCEQSIQKLREAGVKEITRAHLGQYLKWIVGDVIKEESDTAAGNGIDIQKIGGSLSNAAKKWFFENENSL